MISIDDDLIQSMSKQFFAFYNSSASAPLFEQKFVEKSFPVLAEKAEAYRWNMLKKDLKFQETITTNLITKIKGVLSGSIILGNDDYKYTEKDLAIAEKRLARVKKDREQAEHSLYPYNVYIPKSILEMKQGDFEPAKVIVIDKPIMGEWGPMWFGCSKDGVFLRYGYKNGDSRFVSDFALDDNTPHGIMAGTTGSGKSVALNTVIYGACYEYAPWEINFTLSDAKIVEFKSLAKNNPMPQITTVAATTDADYLASIVTFKEREMKEVNSMFTTAGNVFGSDVKNIMDFRKTTGLSLPRNIMVFDEFQAMFAGAGKQLKTLIGSIDSFARLGRNTGYHLYLTSQEIGSDVPQGTLNNISLRCALGCDPAVSEKIIGNDSAKINKGKKGKLIVNTEAQNCNKKDNVPVTIPFCSPENANAMADQAIKKGREFDVTPVLRFYDQDDILYEDKYKNFIHKFRKDKNRIILGEPSYMMDSKEQCVDIKFLGESNEHVMVISATIDHLIRHFKEMCMNQDYSDIKNIVMCAENLFSKKANAESLCETNKNFYFDDASFDSEYFNIVNSLVFRRRLCIDVDKKVFADPTSTEESNEMFRTLFEGDESLNTPTNKSRFYHMVGTLKTSALFRKAFHLTGSASDDAIMNKTIKSCIKMYAAYGAAERKLSFNDLPRFNMWMLGLNKIMGLGRDSKTKNVELLKQIMQEASQVNIHFFIFTTNVEDTADLRGAIRWFIFDNPNGNDINRVKCNEYYPAAVNGVLAVMVDSDDKEHPKKFKKLFFDGETPPS